MDTTGTACGNVMVVKSLVFLTHWHTLSMLPWLRVTPSTACHSVCATCPATRNNCSLAEASPVFDTVCVGVITFQGVLIANRFCYNGNGCLFDSQRHQTLPLCRDVIVTHGVHGWWLIA